jgi:hypothetical protein
LPILAAAVLGLLLPLAAWSFGADGRAGSAATPGVMLDEAAARPAHPAVRR